NLTYKVYSVEHEGNIEYFTEIIVEVVSGNNNLNNINIWHEIPKEVARDVSEVIFKNTPSVLNNDPVVKWNIDLINKNSSKEFIYFVNKKVDSGNFRTLGLGVLNIYEIQDIEDVSESNFNVLDVDEKENFEKSALTGYFIFSNFVGKIIILLIGFGLIIYGFILINKKRKL
ncbi:MAG: hypothetical protein PHN22_03410, partial [Candidatus ainarchaeum sp.]|nr:hypothetical protein [Candidatus ainarchaeum sp.]